MLSQAVIDFRKGKYGKTLPSNATVAVAEKLAEGAKALNLPEMGVSSQGDFFIDIRNHSGQLILGELMPDGALGATLFNQCDEAIERLTPMYSEDGVNSNLNRILGWMKQ